MTLSAPTIIRVSFAILALFASAFGPTLAIETNGGPPPGLASNPLAARPPAVGTINGVRLSIPNYYLLAGVQYKGEEPLMRTPRTFTPTIDLEIEHFAIRIRSSNFQPIKTLEDLHDLYELRRTSKSSYDETWIAIGVYPKLYVSTGTVEKERDSWEHDAVLTNRGPFTRQPDLMYGLAHSTSPHPVDDAPSGIRYHGWGFDYFFDEATSKTFIYCHTVKMFVAPFAINTRCTHHFTIPELHAVAEAFHTKSDLSRWREIEEHAKSIFHTFVVQ